MREAEAQEEEELKMIQSLADELQKVEEQKIETRMNTDLAKMKVEKGQAVLQVNDQIHSTVRCVTSCFCSGTIVMVILGL